MNINKELACAKYRIFIKESHDNENEFSITVEEHRLDYRGERASQLIKQDVVGGYNDYIDAEKDLKTWEDLDLKDYQRFGYRDQDFSPVVVYISPFSEDDWLMYWEQVRQIDDED